MATNLVEGGKPFHKLLQFGLAKRGERASHAIISRGNFLSILAPMLAITCAVNLLHIEQSLQLPTLMWVVLAGFTINAWMPLDWRLPAFLGLNIIALMLLFGPLVTVLTLGLGLLLVALASLAIRLLYRVLLILGVVGYLALAKAGYVGDGMMYQVSGILGGLFMFRLILYLYEVRHEKEQASVWQRITYFFLLPNLIFQLFPIVDYKTFIRGYYAKPAFATYRKGLEWVGLGVVHLLLYRIIYHYGVVPAEEVGSFSQLLQYLVAAYALILRLSGLFHLSAGIVCLFGFDLPRTFDNYFLASSFSDLWHRINSYWREFVMKVFYFPVYFRFKHLGAWGVFISVLLVFMVNFSLHAYQWFWIRGTVTITQTDMLFWGILGLLLACNSVISMRRNTRRGKARYSLKGAFQKALKVLGMFTFMCLMWSLWTSGTVEQWLLPFIQAGLPDALQMLTLLTVCMVLIVLGVCYQFLLFRGGAMANILKFSPLGVPWLNGLLFVVICTLASAPILSQLGRLLDINLSAVTAETLNVHDEELMFRGYYEELIVPNTLTSRMWELEEQQKNTREDVANSQHEPKGSRENRKRKHRKEDVLRKYPLAAVDWRASRKKLMQEGIGHPPWKRYKPNQSRIYRGATFTINQFGLRDQNYSLKTPPGAYRIIQLGGSPEEGIGVNDNETSEYLLEQRLNSSGPWGGYTKIEIINFSKGGFSLFELMGSVEHEIDAFEPDAAMLFVHDTDVLKRFGQKLTDSVFDGHADDFPELLELWENLGLHRDMSKKQINRLMEPHTFDLYTRVLERIVQHCEENNIRLILVMVGTTKHNPRFSQANATTLYPLLRDSGHVFFDLVNVFRSRPAEELFVAPWDHHPNPLAQQMVADRLFELMLANQEKILKE